MINEEALEAALLAKMVSTGLNEIDNLSTDRSSMPASRINMNEFLGAIKPPRNSPQQAHYNAPQQPTPSVSPVESVNSNSETEIRIQNELKDDIKSIRCNLEKINNNLTKIAGMFGKVFHNISKNSNND